MEFTILLISKLISLMLMAVAGYVLVKCRVLKLEDSKPLSSLTVYFLQPCLIIRSFQIELTADRMRSLLVGIVFAFAVHALWIVLTRVLRKPLRLSAIDRTSLIYTNAGNLVLPLISMTLGEEYVFYASAYQVAFNILLWSHGQTVIRGEKGDLPLKKMILNPNMLSVFIGLALMLARIKIPSVIDTTASGFSSMVGPCSMLVIGMVITDTDLRKVFGDARAWFIAVGRLIVLPLTVIILLFLTGFLRRYPVYIPVLLAGMFPAAAPSATSVAQMAVLYDREPLKASIYNVITLLLCTATMPFVLWLYRVLFPM